MSKYVINYGTEEDKHAKYIEADADLVMQIADKGAKYTQKDILILNEKKEVVAIRLWKEPGEPRWFELDEECTEYVKNEDYLKEYHDALISFGDLGYYDEWMFILYGDVSAVRHFKTIMNLTVEECAKDEDILYNSIIVVHDPEKHNGEATKTIIKLT